MKFLDTPKNQCYIFPPSGKSREDSVIVVGRQTVRKDDPYPLEGFPEIALFKDKGGRCINNFQLVYISEGNGIFRDRGVTYEIGPGSMLLVKPGVWHSYCPSRNTGWTEYYIGFDGNLFARIVKDGFTQNGTMRRIKDKEKIEDILQRMIVYARNESEDVNILLKALLTLLISEIVSKSDTAWQFEDYHLNILSSSRDYMEENISRKINLNELAANHGVSYSTFKNIFKRMAGVSPVEFLIEMRLRKSKYLLCTTEQSIKAIAIVCGFGSPAHFCNVFKKENGITPQEFREQHKLHTVEL